ncbi:MAG: acylphosphatase [Pirellulaceae bacterium]
MSIQRLSVRFEGRVQGVGFRMSVAEIAGNFAVTGRVRNVMDGSVDLQAEGARTSCCVFERPLASGWTALLSMPTSGGVR